MRPIGRITVPSVIPTRLARLSDIAGNLWWTWNCEVVEMFRAIDSTLWTDTGANPLSFLQRVDSSRLETLSKDQDFLDMYDNVVARFDEYMSNTDTWFSNTYPDKKEHMVA